MRADWAVIVPVMAAAGLAIWGAHLALGVPKPLALVLSGTFLAWTVAFWSFSRRGQRSVYARVAGWLAPWAIGVATFLAVVYRVDRAGWLWFRLTGYDTTWPEDLADQSSLAAGEFLARHPDFVADPQSPGAARLPPGSYDLWDTVVVPRGVTLTIEPGAELRFGAGRSLVAYGPIIARGTADRPIVFTARTPWLKWGAVAVVDAGPSVFEHVRMAHGREARVNGLDLTGALTLWRADAEVAHSALGPLFGKDAIYVREGRIDIHDNEVRQARKDGLDLDGGRGVVRGNRFVDCGDEGIDLSGDLDVEVRDNTVLDDRGGRIAAEVDEAAIAGRNVLGFSGEGGRE